MKDFLPVEEAAHGLAELELALAERDELREALREALREYADHQSWRCEHAPHYYLDDSSQVPVDDCYCGLRKTLADLGIEL